MSISIISQHWLSYFFFAKPERLSICVNGITDRHGLTPWQSIPAIPTQDQGMFFSALHWQNKQKPQQCHWLLKSHVEHIHFKMGKHWCGAHQNKLILFSEAAKSLLTKSYLRKQAFEKLVESVNMYLGNWPKSPDPDWLSGLGHHSMAYLKRIAQLTEQDLVNIQQAFVQKQKRLYAPLFDRLESHPLTDLQQTACIINEQNNLILAGAGTGKTSTMVGRVGYMLQSKQATSEQILLLAYGKKAASEMDERIRETLQVYDVSANTFHALGLKIIKTATGNTPVLSELATSNKKKEQWVRNTYKGLLQNETIQKHTINYLQQQLYRIKNGFCFKRKGDYFNYLAEQNVVSFLDEPMRCFGELIIANYLTSIGVEYQYLTKFQGASNRKPYPISDFANKPYVVSFYLPKYKIYIEHWQCNEREQTPQYLCASTYRSQLEHKRGLHRTHQTQLIETFAVSEQATNNEFIYQGLLTSLTADLTVLGVDCTPVPATILLQQLSERRVMKEFYKQLADMLSLIKAARLLNKSKDVQRQAPSFSSDVSIYQQKGAFNVLTPLFKAYQKHLHDRREIDFDDMINMAISHVQSRRYISPYKQILIDEFQDISTSRALLVKALRDQVKNASLFCVGDDWQAIYRFAGSDVSLTMTFAKFFGSSQISKLDQTFRFNNSISEVAEKFVCQNPNQIRKSLKAYQQVNEPAISWLNSTSAQLEEHLTLILDKIAHKNTQYELGVGKKKILSVFILSRFAFNLPNGTLLQKLKQRYPGINITCHSMHASKGLEADAVIVTGLHNSKNGFPSKKTQPKFIDGLLAYEPKFEHAEERRLFYVALTRARHLVYLLSDPVQPSAFIEEMLIANYPIKQLKSHHDRQDSLSIKQESSCPDCETGTMVAKDYQGSLFYSCSNYPRCYYSE